MGIPVLAASVGLSIYLRTSPFPPSLALADLIAIGGCAAAEQVGLAPAYRGEPGYHAKNDPDGDGIACDTRMASAMTGEAATQDEAEQPYGQVTNRAGGAKFVRP